MSAPILPIRSPKVTLVPATAPEASLDFMRWLIEQARKKRDERAAKNEAA